MKGFITLAGTKLPFTMKLVSSIPFCFTETAKYTVNDLVARFLKKQAEEGVVTKNLKSKLMLIVLLDHMLRHWQPYKDDSSIKR